MDGFRVCEQCLTPLPISEFRRLPRAKLSGGYTRKCKRCLAADRVREWEREIEKLRMYIARVDAARTAEQERIREFNRRRHAAAGERGNA